MQALSTPSQPLSYSKEALTKTRQGLEGSQALKYLSKVRGLLYLGTQYPVEVENTHYCSDGRSNKKGEPQDSAW